MKAIILIILLSPLFHFFDQVKSYPVPIDPEEPTCTVKIGDKEYEVKYVYALNIPEPFDETQRMVKLVCVQKSIEEDQLLDKFKLHEAFHEEGQKGFMLDLKKDGSALSIRLNWDEHTTMWSGAVTEIHFDGTIDDNKISGKVITDPDLSIFGKETKWSVTIDLDMDIPTSW